MNKIVKNTSYLTSAFIVQKMLVFIYFTLIARYLGAEQTGLYTVALDFTTLFAVFVDMGLTHVLVRETAKDTEQSKKLLQNTLGLKIIFALVTYVAIVITILMIEDLALSRNLVYLAGLLMVLDSFILSFWGVFRGYQNLKYEASAVIISQTIIVGFGAFVLINGWPMPWLIVALICGSSFTFIYSYFLLVKKLKIKPSFSYDKAILKTMFFYAWPFALLHLFTRFYSKLDIVLLKYIGGASGATWAGLYSVPNRITFALQFVPAALAAAMYPAMSEYYVKSHQDLKRVFEKAMYLLIIFSIPAAVGIGLLADQIILRIYADEYILSILPLQILIGGMIFGFIQFPVGALLNASNNQKINTRNMGIVLVLNIIANLILIPKYAFVGASIVALVSQALLFILGIGHCKKVIAYNKQYLWTVAGKTIISAIIMGLVVMLIKPWFSESGIVFALLNLLVIPIIGVIVYLISMLALKAIEKEDLNRLKTVWQKLALRRSTTVD